MAFFSVTWLECTWWLFKKCLLIWKLGLPLCMNLLYTCILFLYFLVLLDKCFINVYLFLVLPWQGHWFESSLGAGQGTYNPGYLSKNSVIMYISLQLRFLCVNIWNLFTSPQVSWQQLLNVNMRSIFLNWSFVFKVQNL